MQCMGRVEILTLNVAVRKVNHTAEDISLLCVCGVGRFFTVAWYAHASRCKNSD
jgi:hypothetical protein